VSSSPGISASEVRIAKKIAYKIWAKKALRAILGLFVVALIGYALIAATMTRFVPTNLGVVEVVSPNFPGGQANPGTVVLIDPTKSYDPKNIFTNLLMAISPHANVLKVEILEGPYGTTNWDKYDIDRAEDSPLDGEYVFKCLEGCGQGEDTITYGAMDPLWILGVPVDREAS